MRKRIEWKGQKDRQDALGKQGVCQQSMIRPHEQTKMPTFHPRRLMNVAPGLLSLRPAVVLALFLAVAGCLIGGMARSEDLADTTTDNQSKLSSVSDQEFAQRSRPLFNRETLAGWEGRTYWFRVEDEAIVAGRLEEKIPKNQFLSTTEVFNDFDIRMQVRLRGQGNNAGVQFRSRRPQTDEKIAANEMIGYQADMGHAFGRSVWGAIYDESRRRKMLVLPEPPIDVDKTDVTTGETTVAETPWVDLRIVCKGDQMEVFLDGQLAVQFTEKDKEIPNAGRFGLQIHSGPPTEAWYRNIRILSL